jgi:(2Fe-2S) ferredoxin
MVEQSIFPFEVTKEYTYNGIISNDKSFDVTPYIQNLSRNDIQSYKINNPYFDNILELYDKFGSLTNKYIKTNVSINVSGSYQTEIRIKNGLCCCSTEHFKIFINNVEKYSEDKSRNDVNLTLDLNNITTFNNVSLRFVYSNYAGPAECEVKSPANVNLVIQIKFKGEIYMDQFCSDNFNDPVCLKFCNDQPNLCIYPSISWCFNNSQPQFSRIFQNLSCKTFIKNYISSNISHSEYDRKFKEICKKLEVDASNYKNYTNGTDPQLDLDIKNICACNLDESIYNNFYESFSSEIPSIRAANFGSKKCIFPECNTSEYKPTEIQGYNVCPRIDCINVTQIDNNGRIIGGLSINQSNNCPNIEDPRKPCIQDGDCSVGNKCLQGGCVEEKVCRSNSNCNVDSKCFNNICVRDDYCAKDSDCGEGLKCSKNICVKNISTNNNFVLIIFISIIVILFVFFGFILIIYFIKRIKRSS